MLKFRLNPSSYSASLKPIVFVDPKTVVAISGDSQQQPACIYLKSGHKFSIVETVEEVYSVLEKENERIALLNKATHSHCTH